MADQPLEKQMNVAPPPGADYDHIFMAMMETARGRWFLSEYAKRNRNAETEKLMTVLGRIEAAVVTPPPEAQQRTPEDRATEAARAAALTRLASDYGEKTHHLVKALRTAAHAIRHSTEQLQDTSWDLREQKYDDSICDALDGRTREITNACVSLDQAIDAAHGLAVLIAGLVGDDPAPFQSEPSASAAKDNLISDISKAVEQVAQERPANEADAPGLVWQEAEVGSDLEAQSADWDVAPPKDAGKTDSDDVQLDADLFAPEPKGTSIEAAVAKASESGVITLSFAGAAAMKAEASPANGWFTSFLDRISGEDETTDKNFKWKATTDNAWLATASPGSSRSEPVFDLPKQAGRMPGASGRLRAQRGDAMAPIRAMSPEERIALFS